MAINISLETAMSVYSLNSNSVSQVSPKLKKGQLRIYTSTTIFWSIGENPTAGNNGCAILRGGSTLELRLPVECSRLAVLAVDTPGVVTISEINGRVKASCAQ